MPYFLSFSSQLMCKTDFNDNYDLKISFENQRIVYYRNSLLTASSSFQKRRINDINVSYYRLNFNNNYSPHKIAVSLGCELKEITYNKNKFDIGMLLGMKKIWGKLSIHGDIVFYDEYIEYGLSIFQRIRLLQSNSLSFGLLFKNYKQSNEFNFILRYDINKPTVII